MSDSYLAWLRHGAGRARPRWLALWAPLVLGACQGTIHPWGDDGGADVATTREDAASREDIAAPLDAPADDAPADDALADAAPDDAAPDDAAPDAAFDAIGDDVPGDGAPGPDGGPAPDAVADVPVAADGPTSVCVGRTGLPGDRVMEVVSGGRRRQFLVHVPVSYNAATPMPVVLNFHGFTSNPLEQQASSGMNAAADARGFIAVHPEGVEQSWNAGGCCGSAQRAGVDDVQFVRDLLAAVERDWCVDTRRVFATGFSNGGKISYRLACELADRIAAIGPVGGVDVTTHCTTSRPVPVIHSHGTADLVVPYGGGGVTMFRSAPETAAAWAARNDCGDAPVEVYRRGQAHCDAWSGCAGGSEVVLCTLEGYGHFWPRTADFDATAQVLDFFARHPMP